MTNVTKIDNRRSISDQLAAETPDLPKTADEIIEVERAKLRAANPENIAKATKTTEELDKEFYQRVDAEVRLANALGRVKLDAEQNAALAGSLAPAMNDAAHKELRNDAMNLMHALGQIFIQNGCDFHGERFLETLCWKLNDFEARVQQNQDEIDLKIAACFNTGSEVAEKQALRHLAWKDRLTHQQFIINDLKDAAEEVFFETTGRAYTPMAARDQMFVSAELVRARQIALKVAEQKAAKAAKEAAAAAAAKALAEHVGAAVAETPSA